MERSERSSGVCLEPSSINPSGGGEGYPAMQSQSGAVDDTMDVSIHAAAVRVLPRLHTEVKGKVR